MLTQDWTVSITIDEDKDHTHATAVLRDQQGERLHSDGSARRNPSDASVPEIGEELAVARALYALADHLMETADKDVENLSHPV